VQQLESLQEQLTQLQNDIKKLKDQDKVKVEGNYKIVHCHNRNNTYI
jgi:hypothetical protein